MLCSLELSSPRLEADLSTRSASILQQATGSDTWYFLVSDMDSHFNLVSLLVKHHPSLKTLQLLPLTVPRHCNPLLTLVTQTYGGAIFVSVAQNIFSNKLIQGIVSGVAGVDPMLV